MYNNVTCIRKCTLINMQFHGSTAVEWILMKCVFFFSTEKQINLFLENNVKMYRGENILEKISEKVYQNHS